MLFLFGSVMVFGKGLYYSTQKGTRYEGLGRF